MKYHITKKSSNSKTGPIPVTTSPRDTCPKRCPLKNSGCYADGGPLRVHWDQVSKGKRGEDWATFMAQIRGLPDGQLWRHNQAGDLKAKSKTKKIDKQALNQLCSANEKKRGFTYTHYQVLEPGLTSEWNKDAISKANARGFTVNLSADSLGEADRLAELNIGPVTTTLPSETTSKTLRTPGGRSVLVCPAARNDKKRPTCEACGLCAT
ncbi:unnamed protein product, partial [marine sediment metagenome]